MANGWEDDTFHWTPENPRPDTSWHWNRSDRTLNWLRWIAVAGPLAGWTVGVVWVPAAGFLLAAFWLLACLGVYLVQANRDVTDHLQRRRR